MCTEGSLFMTHILQLKVFHISWKKMSRMQVIYPSVCLHNKINLSLALSQFFCICAFQYGLKLSEGRFKWLPTYKFNMLGFCQYACRISSPILPGKGEDINLIMHTKTNRQATYPSCLSNYISILTIFQ